MKKNYRKQLEQRGLLAVQHIRRETLEQGHPFMINTDKLPNGQCYLEFPDGTIQVFTICPIHNDFKLVRELTPQEQSSVRKKLLLIS